jgi:signal peptidase I
MADSQSDRSFFSVVIEYAVIFVVAFALAYFLQNFVFGNFVIKQHSMEPNFYEYDRVFINRLVYKFSSPKPGDIVILIDPMGSQDDFIKRVIAGPNDLFAMKDGDVYVNSKKLNEPYIAKDKAVDTLGPFRIPAGEYFVMGDNRAVSQDSRRFGPVTKAEILGKVMVIWWPPNHARIPH